MNLSGIDWLGVIIASVASFVVGFFWYGPLFGKPWQRLVGLTDEEIKNANFTKIFGMSFILTLVMAITISVLFPAELTDANDGAAIGAILGIGLVATAMGINAQFSRRPTALWLIDAGYMVVITTLMGAIIGAF